jgi:hypothetical protein
LQILHKTDWICLETDEPVWIGSPAAFPAGSPVVRHLKDAIETEAGKERPSGGSYLWFMNHLKAVVQGEGLQGDVRSPAAFHPVPIWKPHAMFRDIDQLPAELVNAMRCAHGLAQIHQHKPDKRPQTLSRKCFYIEFIVDLLGPTSPFVEQGLLKPFDYMFFDGIANPLGTSLLHETGGLGDLQVQIETDRKSVFPTKYKSACKWLLFRGLVK